MKRFLPSSLVNGKDLFAHTEATEPSRKRIKNEHRCIVIAGWAVYASPEFSVKSCWKQKHVQKLYVWGPRCLTRARPRPASPWRGSRLRSSRRIACDGPSAIVRRLWSATCFVLSCKLCPSSPCSSLNLRMSRETIMNGCIFLVLMWALQESCSTMNVEHLKNVWKVS